MHLTSKPGSVCRIQSSHRLWHPGRQADTSFVHSSDSENIGTAFNQTSDRKTSKLHGILIALGPVGGTNLTPEKYKQREQCGEGKNMNSGHPHAFAAPPSVGFIGWSVTFPQQNYCHTGDIKAAASRHQAEVPAGHALNPSQLHPLFPELKKG